MKPQILFVALLAWAAVAESAAYVEPREALSVGGGIGRLSGQVMALVFLGAVIVPPVLGVASELADSWTLLWALAAALVAAAGAVLWLGVRS